MAADKAICGRFFGRYFGLFRCSLPLAGLGGITAMARPCILGLMVAVLTIGPGFAFDGSTGLPKGLRFDEKSCLIDERITLQGTIQDMMRRPGGWSAGVLARANHCKGLTDPSTGFTALFGDGKPPSDCEQGSRFWASGTARSGFEPAYYLHVESIKCE